MSFRSFVSRARSWGSVLPAWVILVAIAVSFALANGLAYGVSNHNQYLLHGLRALDGDFLAGDWFTCTTKPHHSAFVPLMVLFSKIGPMPILFAVANGLAACVVVLCLYALARKWFERPLLVAAMAVFLIVIVPRPYVGLTSLIGLIFQPSTIGAVGLFAGLVLLSLGRVRNAGLVLGAASIFHINYMVWAVLIVGVVVLSDYVRVKARGALWLLGPLAISVLYHLPFIAASRAGDQVIDADLADWILHDLYMPYHSRPFTWPPASFFQFGALMLAGGVAIGIAPPRRVSRPAKTIAATIAAIVVIGMLLTTIWQVDVVALLFPYRLAPILVTLALLLIAGASVQSLVSDCIPLWRSLMLLAVTCGALIVCDVENYAFVTWCTLMTIALAARAASDGRQHAVLLLTVLGGMVIVALSFGVGRIQLALTLSAIGVAFVCRSAMRDHTESMIHPIARLGTSACTGLCLVLIVGFVSRVGVHRKDTLGPPPQRADAELYDWCRSTPIGSQFVVPPDLAGFRLHSGRGVVIDWKCMPILPADTLAWYERLVDVAGVRFTSREQCLAGYRMLDAERALGLAQNYRANYVVTRAREHLGSLGAFPVVLRTADWRVYRIDSPMGDAIATDDVRDH